MVLRSCSPSSWSAAGAAVAARASANPPPPRPSSPPSRPSRRVMDSAAGAGRHRVRIAVVGDVVPSISLDNHVLLWREGTPDIWVWYWYSPLLSHVGFQVQGIRSKKHNDWALEEDSKALQFLQPDLVLFTGDYGNENVELVKSISDLQLPKAAILGNHDCWHTHQFSEKKVDRVRLQLASLGEQHVGYKCLDFPSIKLSVVGGRPFSCGGDRLFRPKLLSKCYGVNDMAGSAKKIYDAAAGAPEGHSVILLAHNGPTGLGSRMDDICGRDWVPGAGDHGDPDLERAISDLQREARVSIPLVVFGHMHKSLAYGRGLRKMIAFGANHTIYLNGAVVPRVKFAQTIPRYEQNQPEGSGPIAPTLRAFTVADLSEGRVEKISEVWVLVSGARTEVEEEIVLYKHPREHV